MKQLVLFDGACHFCNSSVQFIINRDDQALFRFASLQSEVAKEIFLKHQLPIELDSMVLVVDNHIYTKSTAALEIARNLNGFWKYFYILKLIPRPIRDFFYDRFANNRYKWFGKQSSCDIPSQEIRERFLDS